MSRLIFLRWLIGLVGSWPLHPAAGPAGAMIVSVPKGWAVEYHDRSLFAERGDGGAGFSLTLTPKVDAPPTDVELLALGGVNDGDAISPVVCRELDGTYLRTVEYRRGNRYGLYAGIYVARRLWLWRLEGPWRERESLGPLAKVALYGLDCRLPLAVARERHDFGDELTIRTGPGFRLSLPQQWRIVSAGAYDFLADLRVYDTPVAEIGVIVSGRSSDNEDRALFLEGMLLDVESHRPGFRLLDSMPSEAAGLLAQKLNGIYTVDGVPFRWKAVVLFGRRGTYAIHGETAEANHGRFEPLFDRVVESLREGSMRTWYEVLWDFLSKNVLTVFIPLLIAVAAGLFFGLRWFWRFLVRYTR